MNIGVSFMYMLYNNVSMKGLEAGILGGGWLLLKKLCLCTVVIIVGIK